MVATAIYSVTMVLWTETAFPLCRVMERRITIMKSEQLAFNWLHFMLRVSAITADSDILILMRRSFDSADSVSSLKFKRQDGPSPK